MIWTVFEVNLRRLIHNRVELLLTFVVPIAFFSVFALIFGGGVGGGSTPKINAIVVDQVDSPVSHAVVDSLEKSAGLRLKRGTSQDSLTAEHARELVRRGAATLAIVLQAEGDSVSAELLTDASDQVAGQVATALVGRSLMLARATPAQQRQTGLPAGVTGANVHAQEKSLDDSSTLAADTLRRFSAKPESQRVDRPLPADDSTSIATETSLEGTAGATAAVEDVSEAVQIVDVMGEGKTNPVVSMYAAGIAVMFLLFGATGGGGALLEERESQTLDRLLSTRLTMDHLILGKWFYMTAIGVLQVTVMFLWGQIVFGVDLVGHLDGFLIMTVVTASAASAFGLFLATLCRTRGQLNGLSVILVLTMSALGGSMVPRYVMSPGLREFGLWTFNAWALDGYDKVFWRELPAASLSPQLTVLLGCGMAFLIAARAFAVRWESE